MRYDYMCEACGFSFEASHHHTEKPILPCPKCGSKITHKVPCLCGIVVKDSRARTRAKDALHRDAEVRSDLAVSYGVENVTPLRGQTVNDVYKDIKSRGGFVREEMAKSAEESAAKTGVKRKEWKKVAARRVVPRRLEMERRKAAEDAKKRAIRL